MAAVQDVWDKLTQTAVEKNPTMFAVYQSLKAHSCSVDWGTESVPLWEHTFHVHAATPARPFISLQPRPQNTQTGRTCAFDFFFFLSFPANKRPLPEHDTSASHSGNFPTWLIVHFLDARQLKSLWNHSGSRALYVNQKRCARHASLQVLVRGNLERRSASACGGGDSCRLGRFFARPINDHEESICSNKPRKRTQIQWNCSVISPCRWWISFSQRTACAFYPVYTRVKYVMTYFPTH